jgi:ureidoglycolate hydrolase
LGVRQTKEVPVEVMSAEAFEPFGWVIDAPQDAPPSLVGIHTRGWEMPFDVTGRVQVCALYTEFAELRFAKLERHLFVTQTFIALDGPPSVVAVAGGAESERTLPPHPDEVRAFRIDPARGYVLRRGTWHSLDRFPLRPPGARFAMITEAETTAEIGQAQAQSRTDVFDYAEELGIEFEFAAEAVP